MAIMTATRYSRNEQVKMIRKEQKNNSIIERNIAFAKIELYSVPSITFGGDCAPEPIFTNTDDSTLSVKIRTVYYKKWNSALYRYSHQQHIAKK